jgi:hypothetical protein
LLQCREKAYFPFYELAKRTDLTKEAKAEYLSMFWKGMSDPEPSIQLQCITHLGYLGSDAKEAADRLRKIAATHDNKAFRDAAAESLKKIEK